MDIRKIVCHPWKVDKPSHYIKIKKMAKYDYRQGVIDACDYCQMNYEES